MRSPTLNPFALLGQTLPILPSVYLPLVILASPMIALSLVTSLVPALESPLSLAYTIVISPVLIGASLIFIDRQLKGIRIEVSAALQEGIAEFNSLLSGSIFQFIVVFLGTLALIIPGIYMGLALIFMINAIVLVESSRLDTALPMPIIDGLAKAIARDALGAARYSWQLVTPRWFTVLVAHIGFGLCILIPAVVGIGGIAILTYMSGSTLIAGVLAAVLVALLFPIYLVWDYLLFRSLEQL